MRRQVGFRRPAIGSKCMTKLLTISFPGNAESIATFGGAPHYLIKAFQRQALDSIGLDLTPSVGNNRRRYRWNAKEMVNFRGLGGYQYSDEYLHDIWRNQPVEAPDRIIINLFQMYDTKFFKKTASKKIFYIDQTLRQLFSGYKQVPAVSKAHQRVAIEKEQTQYRSCELVICMCRWAANSVIAEYGVSPEKGAVVLPGGNIEDQAFRGFVKDRHMQSAAPD